MATQNSINLDERIQDCGIHSWNGSTLETPVFTVTSDGVTITVSVEKEGGGNLSVIFSDGFFVWDTTPADTITLTAGSDTSPQINYVYFLQSTKAITVSTVDWPDAEHLPLATVLCQTAASLQTDGAYKIHVWTNHTQSAIGQGHIGMVNLWIRQHNATWRSGVTPTLTIDTGPSPDTVIFTSTSGEVFQLHTHVFPAFSGTPDIYTINDSATPYNIVTDLNTLLTDATGASMSGKYFSLVIWGVASDMEADCKLMVNLPAGSYGNASSLEADDSKFATFSIPSDFKGTGFLIAQYNLRHQVGGGGRWTLQQTHDLRGFEPSIAPGSATSEATMFEDNTFSIMDEADNTKSISFQANQITTATTRTITMADRNVDLDNIMPVSEETGTSVSMVVNSRYISNNASQVVLTLPTTAAVGSTLLVTGKGAGGWRVAQNAGESIILTEASATTTGVTGYIESADDYDSVELICLTANTTWGVIFSKGTLTVV